MGNVTPELRARSGAENDRSARNCTAPQLGARRHLPQPPHLLHASPVMFSVQNDASHVHQPRLSPDLGGVPTCKRCKPARKRHWHHRKQIPSSVATMGVVLVLRRPLPPERVAVIAGVIVLAVANGFDYYIWTLLPLQVFFWGLLAVAVADAHPQQENTR